MGWLLLSIGLLVPVSGILYGYVRYGLLARPGALPAASYLAGISNPGIVALLPACGGFILLLTPTGSLPSPRWRWWARVAAVAPVAFLVSAALDPQPLFPEYPTVGNPLAIQALPSPLLLAAGAACAIIVLAALVVGAGSLVGRFRRARGVERQQLRWLALAAALASVALLIAVAAVVTSNDELVLAALSSCGQLTR